RTRRARSRLQHRRRVARVGQRGTGDRRAADRPAAERASRARAERGHARHVRRHHAGEDGPRVRAGGDPCGRSRGRVPLAGGEFGSCMSTRARSRSVALILASLVLSLAAACAGRDNDIPTGIREPDRFLFERGSEALNKKRWFTAREYFRRILDGYPQSQYREEAKLGVADSYLGEGTIESLLLAANEYREFLTFYPTSSRADYAQYKLGMVHFRQMRAPQRDQTE